MRPVTILRAAFLPLVFLFACRQSTDPEDGNPDAGDLKIVAFYNAGESLWLDWKYTITGDGNVDVETFEWDGHVRKKRTMLSKEDLTDIVAKFKEAEFHGLRKRYFTIGSDIPTLTLAITENKKTKEVSVNAGWLEKDRAPQLEEVSRFLRVWSEILRKFPSPNAEQKPELYEPQPSTSGQPSSDQKAKLD